MFRSLTGAEVYNWQKHSLSGKNAWCRCFALWKYGTSKKSRTKEKDIEVSTNPYVQGQVVNKHRQYFYYVDAHGRLYLNDTRLKNFLTSFKDKNFLTTIFRGLNVNEDQYKEDFPFFIKCRTWEINYIRCECVPIVFTHLNEQIGEESDIKNYLLIYNHADPAKAWVPFRPDKLFMSDSGRMYHPAPLKAGGIGLISTELSLFFSSMLEFEDGNDKAPSHIWFSHKKLALNREWYKDKVISRFIK